MKDSRQSLNSVGCGEAVLGFASGNMEHFPAGPLAYRQRPAVPLTETQQRMPDIQDENPVQIADGHDVSSSRWLL